MWRGRDNTIAGTGGTAPAIRPATSCHVTLLGERRALDEGYDDGRSDTDPIITTYCPASMSFRAKR